MAKQAKSKKSENDNYDDMEPGEGHRQTQDPNVKKSSEADMEDIKEAEEDGDLGDPFEQMMRKASRNARYSVAYFENRGTADRDDPTNITPDEHDNMPRRRPTKSA